MGFSGTGDRTGVTDIGGGGDVREGCVVSKRLKRSIKRKQFLQ